MLRAVVPLQHLMIEMTESRRIFWNIIATYGRSLYGLALGLLCGRWTLMALGETDYGLIGLVGGLTVFIAFFNSVLAGANARFYAFSVGAAKVAEDKSQALEECRRWFNTALSVHSVVPIALVVIGYPIGAYAIEHWLTIPADRVASCIWVFRFTCISCFMGMLNVPFSAMYGAKQYIAELTIYSFVTASFNVIFLHYMVTHPGVWLTKFAAWSCLLSIVPQIIICIRACMIFPECRIRLDYMWDWTRLKRLGYFSGWQLLGVFCAMLRTQGMTIVVNKFFGERMNAAQTIGNTVQGHCNTLAGAMQGAFIPVITQACGARDYQKMNRFVIRTGKFNVLLSMIFVVPLALELPEVMALWLKNPPDFAIGLCYCAMMFHLVDCCTTGHMVAINACGKIALYQIVVNLVSVMTIPLAILFGVTWRNVYVVMSAVIFVAALVSVVRIVFARFLTQTSAWAWIRGVFVPLSIAIAVSAGFGWLPHLVMDESFLRVCVTTAMCEVVFLPLTWFVLLSNEERRFMVEKFGPRIKKAFGR